MFIMLISLKIKENPLSRALYFFVLLLLTQKQLFPKQQRLSLRVVFKHQGLIW